MRCTGTARAALRTGGADPEPTAINGHEVFDVAPPPARNARPRVTERAERRLLEELADGPASGAHVIAAAAEVDVSERTLIAAAERLGVRSRRGQRWLPNP